MSRGTKRISRGCKEMGWDALADRRMTEITVGRMTEITEEGENGSIA